MNEPIRILIADDHHFFAEGVVNALRPYTQYTVVASVTNGSEALAAIPLYQPDIAILDVNMPGQNGIELMQTIKSKWPGIKIMILSMYMPSDIKLQPEKEGIEAYVLKNSGTEILLTALGELALGQTFYDPNIQLQNHHSADGFSQTLKLSSREKEILQMIKNGDSTKDIAATLFISELTVKTHRKNIMAKMDAKNVAELIRRSG